MNTEPLHRNLYVRWSALLRPHTGYLTIALSAMFCAMAVQIALPKIVGWVIDDLLTTGTIAAGWAVLPWIGARSLTAAFGIVFACLAVMIAVRAGLQYVQNSLLALTGEKVHIDIRQRLFVHLQRVPIAYFDKTYTGRIMARITTDADALWHLVNDGARNIVGPVVSMVVITVILFRLNTRLAWSVALILPVVIFLFAVTRQRARAASRLRQEKLADIYSRLQEQIAAVRIVRIFGQGNEESRSFLADLKELCQRNMHLLKTNYFLGAQMELVTGVTTAAVLCFGGIAVTRGSISVGELVQFYMYAGMLFVPISQLVNTSATVFSTAEVALERIFSLLDQPEAEEVRAGGQPCPPLTGRISIEDLSFGYEPGRLILQNVDLRIKPRETVAFVGPSGVGKTTIVNLLCRFYSPTSGRLRVDDHDITALEIESYRQQISYVTQDSFLFSGSVTDNIRYGNPGISDDAVERAARLANAHDFIMQMPQGYQTAIGERGVNLSGGQKQRLNIARALVRDPRILIMDEPSSALDAESESTLLEALATVFKDKTCIIIAHRLSTVMAVERIFVFSGGRVVQEGPHRELIKVDGVYRELCRKQLVGYGGSATRNAPMGTE
jgi:subfamily B ATP-binding cassette protein MsbA